MKPATVFLYSVRCNLLRLASAGPREHTRMGIAKSIEKGHHEKNDSQNVRMLMDTLMLGLDIYELCTKASNENFDFVKMIRLKSERTDVYPTLIPSNETDKLSKLQELTIKVAYNHIKKLKTKLQQIFGRHYNYDLTQLIQLIVEKLAKKTEVGIISYKICCAF